MPILWVESEKCTVCNVSNNNLKIWIAINAFVQKQFSIPISDQHKKGNSSIVLLIRKRTYHRTECKQLRFFGCQKKSRQKHEKNVRSKNKKEKNGAISEIDKATYKPQNEPDAVLFLLLLLFLLVYRQMFFTFAIQRIISSLKVAHNKIRTLANNNLLINQNGKYVRKSTNAFLHYLFDSSFHFILIVFLA